MHVFRNTLVAHAYVITLLAHVFRILYLVTRT
jgi:hypothetical protein